MPENKYKIRDVLIGIFNNFPKEKISFNYTSYKFDNFFFNNRENYSILNEIAFDKNTHESKELIEAWDNLELSGLIYYTEENPFREIINKDAIDIVYKKFTKKKLNENELGEIEKLSLEFQKEF